MLSLDTLERMSQFERACQEAGSVDQLDMAVINSLSQICVKTYSYHHLPPLGDNAMGPSQAIRYHGYPMDWEGWHKHSGYPSDEPFIKCVFAQSEPSWWNDTYEQAGRPEYFASIMKALADIGVQSGLTLPVFAPDVKSGLISLGFTERRENFTSEQVSTLQWASQVAHYRHIELLGADEPSQMVSSG